MKEKLYEVRCLKSNEDMILALALLADRLGGSEAIPICRKCVLNCLPGDSHNKVNIQSHCQRGWVAEWLRHPTSNLDFHSCNQLSRFLSSNYYIDRYI